MKSLLFQILIICLFTACQSEMKYKSVDDYPVYDGHDLGFTINKDKVTFKLWSPAAQEVKLRIFSEGHGNENLEEIYAMKKGRKGTWSISLDWPEHKDKYYTYQIKQNNAWLQEKPDPYSVAVGVNGQRSMIVDLDETNPVNWDKDLSPDLKGFEDIIIYEMQIRDLTIHESSGIVAKGKYIGLTERGTKNDLGLSTGLDHITELGVTHVHLLPTFDHRSIDETKLDIPQYNWGYDPLNYNVPEGSFSTDPYNGKVRIKEFKEMVQAFHKAGLRVVLDVVYNHTGQTEDSNFNQLVPDYYYRKTEDNKFSDASACGNETASERAMMRKYILKSVKHWVNEYHIDGFRFDLMGIHDIETMNAITDVLHEIDPSIFVYGEGWTAGDSPLPVKNQALKANTPKLKSVAAFSDDIRDGLKGSVFREEERGFVSQEKGLKESIKFGIVASTDHPQVDYQRVNYSNAPWANSPLQTINYVSCHDNNTLYDKLKLSLPEATEDQLFKMHRLAQTIILTSQGVPFLHAGTELLRSKDGIENSFESPDSINQIDWNRKSDLIENVVYYQKLIQLRKDHPAFRMNSTEQVQNHLEFLPTPTENTLAYVLKDNANGDSWKNILVAFNGHSERKTIALPEGTWITVNDGLTVNQDGLGKAKQNSITIPASTAVILKQD